MKRFARRTVLVLSSIAAIAVIAEMAASETQNAPQDKAVKKQTSQAPVNVKGTRVLLAFDAYGGRSKDRDQRRGEFEQSLKEAEVRTLKQYRYNNYLLIDCGDKNPEEVLATVPYHAGAMIFRDGKLVKTIASYDKKKVPKDYAALRWGSTADGVKRMQADIKKYSNMPGVVAKKIDLAQGKFVFGNPFVLKLTPAEGKTLLEVFVLADAQFDYTQVSPK